MLQQGSALNRADLRAVHLSTCKMCVIVGTSGSSGSTSDPTLVDKSVILATLNVRAMRFSSAEADCFDSLKKNISRPQRTSGYEVPLITDLSNS